MKQRTIIANAIAESLAVPTGYNLTAHTNGQYDNIILAKKGHAHGGVVVAQLHTKSIIVRDKHQHYAPYPYDDPELVDRITDAVHRSANTPELWRSAGDPEWT